MPTSDESCRDVAALAERISSVAEKQRATDVNLLNGIAEIKGLLATHAAHTEARFLEMKEGFKELRADMATLANQTSTQETRLVVVEKETERNTLRVDRCETTMSAHGRRLAQLGLAAVALSIVLPVALENLLEQPSAPTSEVRR